MMNAGGRGGTLYMVTGSVKNCSSDAKQGGMCWQDLKEKYGQVLLVKVAAEKNAEKAFEQSLTILVFNFVTSSP